MEDIPMTTTGAMAYEALAREISAPDCPAETYRRATQALIRGVDAQQPEHQALAGWAAEPKREFLRHLVLQPTCSERPNVMLQQVSSYVSSGADWLAGAVAAAISPVLQREMAAERPALDAVLAVVTLREVLGPAWNQADISRWHLANWHRFGPGDISLPYSCMFAQRAYGRNRQDLIGTQGDGAAAYQNPMLKAYHLLLVEWLATGPTPAEQDAALLLEHLAGLLERAGSDPDGAASRAAARALALRHARSPANIERAGLWERLEVGDVYGESITHVAQRRARILNALSGQSARHRAWMMGTRPYQAIQVARTELMARVRQALGNPRTDNKLGTNAASAQARMPAAARRRRPLIALCVSGQLRGYQSALKTWQERLFPGADWDVYVHTWGKVGQSGVEPHRNHLPFEGAQFKALYRAQCLELGLEAVQSRYPGVFQGLRTGEMVTADTLGQVYRTEHVVVEDDQSEHFKGWSNSRKMHYKIHACSRMALDAGRDHDLIVRIRPDIPIGLVGFHWRDVVKRCQSNALLFADMPFGVHYGLPMMGDQFAMGAPEAMRVYSSTYEIQPELAQHELFGMGAEFAGHASLANVCWFHGLSVERAPMRWLAFAEARALASSELLDAVTRDAVHRNDAWDRRMLDAIRADLGPS